MTARRIDSCQAVIHHPRRNSLRSSLEPHAGARTTWCDRIAQRDIAEGAERDTHHQPWGEASQQGVPAHCAPPTAPPGHRSRASIRVPWPLSGCADQVKCYSLSCRPHRRPAGPRSRALAVALARGDNHRRCGRHRTTTARSASTPLTTSTQVRTDHGAWNGHPAT